MSPGQKCDVARRGRRGRGVGVDRGPGVDTTTVLATHCPTETRKNTQQEDRLFSRCVTVSACPLRRPASRACPSAASQAKVTDTSVAVFPGTTHCLRVTTKYSPGQERGGSYALKCPVPMNLPLGTGSPTHRAFQKTSRPAAAPSPKSCGSRPTSRGPFLCQVGEGSSFLLGVPGA